VQEQKEGRALQRSESYRGDRRYGSKDSKAVSTLVVWGGGLERMGEGAETRRRRGRTGSEETMM
jgi:hypothetical protein